MLVLLPCCCVLRNLYPCALLAPSQPLNVSLSAVPGSPDQLTATWTPPIPKNGIITAYTVYCNNSTALITLVVKGTTQAVIFNVGYYPFTQYSCYVTANTSVGEGAPSQVVNSTTSQTGMLQYNVYNFGDLVIWFRVKCMNMQPGIKQYTLTC